MNSASHITIVCCEMLAAGPALLQCVVKCLPPAQLCYSVSWNVSRRPSSATVCREMLGAGPALLQCVVKC